MRKVPRISLISLLWLLAIGSEALHARAEDWLPVTQEELKMTREPKAPGAPAIYLYRQIDTDDNGGRQHVYVRIKILTEEGRKYADIEIPFLKGTQKLHDLQARTIHPEGNIINFDGKAYEKTIVKAKGVKYLAKTFTMPDVQVGSIVEYRYQVDQYDPTFHWILSEELFTKHAKFSLKPAEGLAMRCSWPAGLPEGTKPPTIEKGVVRLETSGLPAFQVEDYMPPEYEVKPRIDFIYMFNRHPQNDPERFWKEEGKFWYAGVNQFAGERKAMERAVSQIVQPNDTSEIKLRKIYARTQQIRNFSFEREKSSQEERREKLKNTRTVEDVWKHGYGNGAQITWVFLALARAAGFQADPAVVSTRNLYFFNPRLMNANQLNSNVVLVKLDGKDLYLDPGTPFTPFGMLPWSETRVQGLRLDKEGGNWITTTAPEPSESRIERRAALQLTDSGSLEGKVTITFTGMEAMERRMEERDEDDSARKKYLEDQIKECIPVPAEAELTSKPDWESSAPTLVAEFDLKVPGWATAAGHRTLLPVGLFGGIEKHTFEHADRVHPVYFSFPYQHNDDVTITLPSGWEMGDVPNAQDVDLKVATYSLRAANKNGSLQVRRQLMLNLQAVEVKNYPVLRSFFQGVRTGDEQQVIVSAGSTSAQN
jgi:hypothetical protein